MKLLKSLCLRRFLPLLLGCAALVFAQLGCSGGGGGSTGTPTPPVPTYTATFSPLTGVTMPQASYTFASGGSFSFTYTVAAGYQHTVALVASGTGSVNIPANNAPGTYTGTATGTSNLTISLVATPVPTYTATFTLGAGVSMPQTAYTYPSGGSGTFTFSVLPGYQNPLVQKLSGTGTATITSASGGTFTGTSDLVFSLSATSIPLPTYSATFSPLTNVTMAQTSYSYQSGSSFSFTYTVPSGFQNTVATVTQGTGSVNIPANNVPGTYTGTATGTSNLTISLVAAEGSDPGSIAFVVSPEIIAAMRPLIDSYMAAVATDTGCATVLIQNTATPVLIRTQLKAITNLKCAFLIGNIPIVKRQWSSATANWVAWEHYYSGLNFPYNDPTLDSDGYFRLPDIYRLGNHEQLQLNFCPTITTSRIMGPSKVTLVVDVQNYLEKNMRLRGLVPVGSQGLSYVEAFDFGGSFDVALINRVYTPHPIGAFSLLYDVTGNSSKTSFLSALRTTDYVRVSSHGGVNGLVFNGTSQFDSRYDTPSDILSRYIHVDSCGVGDIGYFTGANVGMYGDSMATRLLVQGNTLLVYAATQTIFGLALASVHRACHTDFAVGVGRLPGLVEPYTHLYKGEVTYFGDPTVAMRKPPSGNQPRIVIDNVTLPRESVRETNASITVSSGVAADVVFRNSGTAELEVRGDVFHSYSSTAQIDKGNGGRWWITGYDETFSTIYGAIKIAPGASKTIRITLNRLDHGGIVATGNQEGYFHFSCNDPKVGAFRISVKGKLQ